MRSVTLETDIKDSGAAGIHLTWAHIIGTDHVQ